MNKIYISLIAIALLSGTALANGGLANIGAKSHHGGGGSKDVDLGSGYYKSVEELTERLERLQAQQAAGKQFYGNSKWPIANAIAKTQRALNAAIAAGGGNPPAPVTAAAPAEAAPAPEGPPAETPDTEAPSETPDTEAPSNQPDTETPSESPDTPDAPAPDKPDAPSEPAAQ